MTRVSFQVAALSYDRFMGRFSEPLAVLFADFAGIDGQQSAVLDVGCGPGALSAELADRVGTAAISAIDPSEPFVAAARVRLPDADVRRGNAEQLPWPDATFDAALAQLVVHFMADPVAGLTEMARVTRPGGTVAACVWDLGGATGPLSTFWAAVQDLEPDSTGESMRPGAREGHLAELFDAAGLHDVVDGALTVRVAFPTFDAWWAPYTLGVGPAGAYVAGLDERGQQRLRERCAARLPAAPFEMSATAWTARGIAG